MLTCNNSEVALMCNAITGLDAGDLVLIALNGGDEALELALRISKDKLDSSLLTQEPGVGARLQASVEI